MLLLLALIILVSIFSILGSWYARKYSRPDAIIAIYCSFMILTQILAAKIVDFNLGFATFQASFATIIFAVTFLLTDLVNEKFGRRETHKMIFIAFITQVAMAVFIYISVVMKPASFWNLQQSWVDVFSLNLRITIASWVTFLISENLDAILFSWFRKLTKGKHLWMRNALSSIPALTIDSLLFVSMAFYGIFPIWPMILSQMVIKWAVGIIDIPFMYLNRYILGKPLLQKHR